MNVISWRPLVNYMLASGGDEGVMKVWDLRNFAAGKHLANFSHHRCWCPSCGHADVLLSLDEQIAGSVMLYLHRACLRTLL